jgi:RNA polymerase sigma-70 factor, ECF subfamily
LSVLGNPCRTLCNIGFGFASDKKKLTLMLHQNIQPIYSYPARDVTSFTRVYQYLFPALCLFASKIVSCVQTAKDIVSDVFTTLWERAISFVCFPQMKSWLYRSTFNASINYYNRNRYRALSPNLIESLLTDEDGKHEMPNEKIIEQIKIAIGSLSKQCKRVFSMAYVHHKSNPVIAQRLNISPRTVISHKRLAISHIRKHLREYRLSH